MLNLVRKRDLPDTHGPLPVLYCPTCDQSYPADRAQYRNLPEKHVFTCLTCEAPLVLACKRTVVVPLAHDRALRQFIRTVWQ